MYTRMICAALASFALASSAHAAILSYDFTVNAGPGGYTSSATLPYGLTGNPVLTGTFSVDNTQSGAAAFVSLSYVTGTRSWTVADIAAPTTVIFGGMGELTFFDIRFSQPSNYVISNNTMQVNDGQNFMFCNGCVSFEPSNAVPEPATWAMLIGGFAASGVAVRRRRAPAVSFA